MFYCICVYTETKKFSQSTSQYIHVQTRRLFAVSEQILVPDAPVKRLTNFFGILIMISSW